MIPGTVQVESTPTVKIRTLYGTVHADLYRYKYQVHVLVLGNLMAVLGTYLLNRYVRHVPGGTVTVNCITVYGSYTVKFCMFGKHAEIFFMLR